MSPQEHSPFRIVFWGLVVLVLLLVLIPPLLTPFGHFWAGTGPWPGGGILHLTMTPMIRLMPLLFFFALYAIVVGSLVHRDAARRGMDPWLWTCIAVFVPVFIGVVIYLVVRTSSGEVCGNCGKAIDGGFRLCPYCGHAAGSHCPKCNRAVESSWNLCPNCGHQLHAAPNGNAVQTPPPAEEPPSS